MGLNLKRNKTFKAIVALFILVTFAVSVISCKEAPTVEEANEELAALVEAEATIKNPVVEEEIIPETEETQAEFNESMIKNRLVVCEGAVDQEYPWAIAGEIVPLWYLREYGEREFIVSGVVAGPLRKDIGATGEEELLLPVAFQNPVTKKFYIRDISYGTKDFFSQHDSHWTFSRVPFEDYTFTIVRGGEYGMISGEFKDIESNLIIGDQIALSFLTDLPRGLEEYVNNGDELAKMDKDFLDVYIPNHISVRNAMRSNKNKDLPEVRLFPWTTMFNEAKNNN